MFKISDKKINQILKARNQILELQKIQDSIYEKLLFDLDIESNIPISDITYCVDTRTDKSIIELLKKGYLDECKTLSRPTGTVITKNFKYLNFGQTVEVVKEQMDEYLVRASGDTELIAISKKYIWLTENAEEFEKREKALANNNVYDR